MVVGAGEALLRRLDGPEDGLFPRLAAARDLFDTEEAFQQGRTHTPAQPAQPLACHELRPQGEPVPLL